MEKILANSVENPGDRQLCAINPNLSYKTKNNVYYDNHFKMAINKLFTISQICYSGLSRAHDNGNPQLAVHWSKKGKTNVI